MVSVVVACCSDNFLVFSDGSVVVVFVVVIVVVLVHLVPDLQILSQIHSVLFGLDLIGNPSQLIHNFDLGIKELIEESKKGFERHTAGSGVAGVAVGVKELLGHVVGKCKLLYYRVCVKEFLLIRGLHWVSGQHYWKFQKYLVRNYRFGLQKSKLYP